jgi:RNA polymerase sigma-70 factor (ECF subfamily)
MNSSDAFQAIVDEYYAPLFRFAMSLTRAESDAQDLTHETFYIWATKGYQLRDLSKIKTWLYTTLHRIFLQARRRHTRFPHHDLEEVSQELPVISPPQAPQMDFVQVLAALARVDEVYQAAVALFYLDDCSYKDIAMILKVPVGTVKSRIARGITQLKEFLLSEPSHVSFVRRHRVSAIPVRDEPAAPRESAISLLHLGIKLRSADFEPAPSL